MDTQKILIDVGQEDTLGGVILSNSQFSGKRPVILVIHGWTSSMVHYPSRVEPLVQMGYVVLLFDLRGHGTSTGVLGTLSPQDHLNDCLAAYDYLVTLENVDVNNISIIGSSYGGYLASILTTQRKVHHLVLTVPALYPNSIFENKKGLQRSAETMEYRKEKHTSDHDFALHAINAFRGDLLLIEAENDELLPPSIMENYKAAAQVKYTHIEVKGSDHAMHTPGANEERIKVQSEWFKRFV